MSLRKPSTTTMLFVILVVLMTVAVSAWRGGGWGRGWGRGWGGGYGGWGYGGGWGRGWGGGYGGWGYGGPGYWGGYYTFNAPSNPKNTPVSDEKLSSDGSGGDLHQYQGPMMIDKTRLHDIITNAKLPTGSLEELNHAMDTCKDAMHDNDAIERVVDMLEDFQQRNIDAMKTSEDAISTLLKISFPHDVLIPQEFHHVDDHTEDPTIHPPETQPTPV